MSFEIESEIAEIYRKFETETETIVDAETIIKLN